MTSKTCTLNTIEEAVKIATNCTRSWYRGHSRVIGELVPRLFRHKFYDPMVKNFRPALETEIIELFKRNAPMLSSKPTPDDRDRLGWLSMMQHFKVPTRMLDWTENALLALYFTVAEDIKCDGELWILFPQKLNLYSIDYEGFPIYGENSALNFFATQPYYLDTEKALANEVGLKQPPKGPLAFYPKHISTRMIAQSSVFTIHPQPGSCKHITEAIKDPKHLLKINVPSESKQQLRKDLHALGINTRALFPELDSLSQEIIDEMQVMAYSPPDPTTLF